MGISAAMPIIGTVTNNGILGYKSFRKKGNGNHSVITASVSAVTMEGIVYYGITLKVNRWSDDERRIADSRHPRSIHSSAYHIHIFYGHNVRHQCQFPSENITIVNPASVHHFNIPRAVQRTSNKTFERLVRMIKLCAVGNIGRVKGVPFEIHERVIRLNHIIVPVDQSITRCIRIAF